MNVSFPKCNQAGTEFVISTTDDLQEKVNYLSEDFPVAIFTQTYHHAAIKLGFRGRAGILHQW